MLRAQVSKRLGSFTLNADLVVAERSVTVLVGESGSGKTTLLRLLAGLLMPDRGRIEVDSAVWFDDHSGQAAPAATRTVGYVSQDYALFPHLTVADNVAFGLRALDVPRARVQARVKGTLERLGVGSLAARRPLELSGGQQQRVAIARAIVLEPRLLLLDEPLSSLDVQTRREIRGELKRLLVEMPCMTVYVTHSPAEAMAFGERIIVLESGHVSQCGSRDDLMRHPRSSYVAEFLGVNFFKGSLARDGAREGVRIAIPQGDLLLSAGGVEGEMAVVVHPREITLTLEAPAGSARNVFAGTIEELVPEPPSGELVRVTLSTIPPLIAEVTRQAIEQLGLVERMHVFASFKAAGVVVVE